MNTSEILLISTLLWCHARGDAPEDPSKNSQPQPPFYFPSAPLNAPRPAAPYYIAPVPLNLFPYPRYSQFPQTQQQSVRAQWVPMQPYYPPDLQYFPPYQNYPQSNTQNNGPPQGSVIQTPHQYVYYQRPPVDSSLEGSVQQMPVQQVMVFS